MFRSVRILGIALLGFLASLHVLYAETYPLTEAQVIERALAHNLGIKITEAESQIGQTDILATQSTFDTLLNAEVNYLIDKSDTSIVIFGTDNRELNWNLGLSRRFASGTSAKLEWRNQRFSDNSPFTELEPTYESILEFGISQPLLQNFFGYQDRGRVSLARKNYQALDQRLQRTVAEQVFQVLNDYWRWLTDRRLEQVTVQSLEEAKRFEKISQEKESFGLHESTDVLAARANTLQIGNQVLIIRQAEQNSLGRLRRGLNLAETDNVASTEKIHFSAEQTALEQVLNTALQHRPDYLAAKTQVEAQQLQLALAKNQQWPQLDLLASLQVNGVRDAYGPAVKRTGAFENPAVFIGGQLQFPLENRLARSEKQRADAAKAKALYALKNTEHQVTQNVEEQWRQLNTTIQTVQTNRRIEKLQQEKWQEELKKYRTGRSSSDIVIRYQEDYLNAQRITLGSLFNYRMALLGLRLAQHTLLP